MELVKIITSIIFDLEKIVRQDLTLKKLFIHK
jgi:hypothetical protein